MLSVQEAWGFDNDELDLEKAIPPEYQGDPDSIVDDLYNKLESEEYDY